MERLKDIIQYIQLDQRKDVISEALNNILGLTANEDSKRAIAALDELLISLFKLTQEKSLDLAEKALSILINLTTEEYGARKILHISKQAEPIKLKLISKAVDSIVDENSELADLWCMVLNNITRPKSLVNETLNDLEDENGNCLLLAEAFDNAKHNKKNQHLDYVASIFCNITQTAEGRDLFCSNTFTLIDKFIPHVTTGSKIRRRGILGLLKNICFEDIYHEIIFDQEYKALPTMLYLLCGPEQYSEEELTKFHASLQHLPENKTREEDPELRKIVLESLLQLCADKLSRTELRDNGVYEILREYHKWEHENGKNNECLLTCEKVVDILIRTEDEIGVENYRELKIPDNLYERFTTEDHIYLKDLL